MIDLGNGLILEKTPTGGASLRSSTGCAKTSIYVDSKRLDFLTRALIWIRDSGGDDGSLNLGKVIGLPELPPGTMVKVMICGLPEDGELTEKSGESGPMTGENS